MSNRRNHLLTQRQSVQRLHALRGIQGLMWLSGGMAVDFHCGRWTRPHKDVDLIALETQRATLERELTTCGFGLVNEGTWTTRWTLDGRAVGEIEIVFVEPAEPLTGVLVIPPDDPAGGRPGRYPFIAGYLDPERFRELDGVRFRVCSAEGEWLNRINANQPVDQRASDAKLLGDTHLLAGLIAPSERRRLRESFASRREGV